MARTRLTQLQENFSKTTDANGWTKYDYGNWQQYKKRVTFSQSLTIDSGSAITLSSNNLPSGMSSLSTNFFEARPTYSGNAFDFNINPEMTTASTTLNFTGSATAGTNTATGFIDVTITTP